MIKGRAALYLTKEDIMLHISEYDIYRYYIGRDFKVNKPVSSPFRKDPVPSFLIGNKYNSLYHIDFGDTNYRGSCFDFVQQICACTYPECLQRIATDFGLIKGTSRQVPVYKQPIIIKRIDTLIQVTPRRFTKEDLQYWNEYTIDESTLKNEEIYSIRNLYINKKRVEIPKDEIAFGYLYKEKYWKIYRPHSANKSDKWRSNVPIDTADGLENIINCSKSLVTKSKKDKLVIRKIFPYTAHVQNESLVAFNEETVNHLQLHGGIVYINFDGDQPGKKASITVTSEFGFKHINIPDGWVRKGIKDVADLTKERGLDKVIAHFKKKGLI